MKSSLIFALSLSVSVFAQSTKIESGKESISSYSIKKSTAVDLGYVALFIHNSNSCIDKKLNEKELAEYLPTAKKILNDLEVKHLKEPGVDEKYVLIKSELENEDLDIEIPVLDKGECTFIVDDMKNKFKA